MITALPNHVLRLMRPEDRARLGPAGMTAEEATRKWRGGEERKMHDLFKTDMQRRGFIALTSIFGKRATMPKGWPDFTVLFGGKVVCVEFKTEGEKPKPDQVERIAELQAAGVPVLVAYTVGEAIDFVVKALATEPTETR